MSFQVCRSGRVVKGQYAGCIASGQPLTKSTTERPFLLSGSIVATASASRQGDSLNCVLFFDSLVRSLDYLRFVKLHFYSISLFRSFFLFFEEIVYIKMKEVDDNGNRII